MDLRDYLDVLRARWRLIVVTTLVGVIAAAGASMLTTPMYQSTTKVFINATDSTLNVGTAYTGSLYTQQLVTSLIDVVTSERVTQAVVDDLNLTITPDQLSSKLSASNPLDTVVIEISATDPNPEVAQRIAASAQQQFQAAAQEFVQPAGGGESLVTVKEIEPPTLPTTPISPRTKINLALGFLVGLAIGVGAAVLLETLDTRIKSVEALQKHFEIPILAAIGFDSEAGKKPLITQDRTHSKRAEAFRQLRTNLQFVDIDHRPRSLVVASSIPREGKSTTAVNLAITVAQTGQPVLLVEGDLRRPKVAEYLGIEGGAGLTDVLIGRATVDDVLQPWGPTGNMWVLPAGPLPPNPAELVGSQAMSDLINHLEQRALVIIDAPPLLPVTDGAVLTKMSGGAIIVAAANKVRREQLRTAEESISNVGGRILGLVFNMAPQKGPDAHRYGYNYNYDYKSHAGKRGKLDADFVPTLTRASTGEPTIGAATVRPTGVNGDSSPLKAPVVAAAATTVLPSSAPPPAPAMAAPKPTPAQAPTAVLTAPAPARQTVSAPAAVPARPAAAPMTAAAPAAPATPAPTARTITAIPDPRPTSAPVSAAPPSAPATSPVPAPAAATSAPVVAQVAPDVHDFADNVPADWTPPAPKPAFDPLTAPLDQVQAHQ